MRQALGVLLLREDGTRDPELYGPGAQLQVP
jgi:hypothetical protein